MLRYNSDLPFVGDTSTWFLPWMVMLMVFFAGLTTAGTLSLNSMLSRWNHSISGSLTVQVIPVEENGRINKKKTQREIEDVLDILRKTAGIASANVLTDSQMKSLLKPWLGETVLLDDLPMPHLIDVQLVPNAEIDLGMLKTLLDKNTPNASLDVHRLWLGKLIKLVQTLDFLASMLLGLVITTTSIIVVYVTCSSLAVHRPVIELLHQIGAHDGYISKQYAKRTAVLAFIGAVLGFLSLLPILFLLSSLFGEIQGGLLSEARFEASSWVLLCFVPVLAVLLSALTAYWTVQRILRRML